MDSSLEELKRRLAVLETRLNVESGLHDRDERALADITRTQQYVLLASMSWSPCVGRRALTISQAAALTGRIRAMTRILAERAATITQLRADLNSARAAGAAAEASARIERERAEQISSSSSL
ncbi:hypothetical protein ACI2K4_00510 [Micromonospora sp. NPDC050397]|uniref:hypothetical protein n=1 Tax=Micromonospora sp. NPDC050397 TaxID=3364279 RepID=UPI00384A4E62